MQPIVVTIYFNCGNFRLQQEPNQYVLYECLTCAFFQATGSFAVHPQLTVEVFLPEFGEPNISSVVGQ